MCGNCGSPALSPEIQLSEQAAVLIKVKAKIQCANAKT